MSHADALLESIFTELTIFFKMKDLTRVEHPELTHRDGSVVKSLKFANCEVGAADLTGGAIRVWFSVSSNALDEVVFSPKDGNLIQLATREVVCFFARQAGEFWHAIDTEVVDPLTLFPELKDTPLKEHRYWDGRSNASIGKEFMGEIALEGTDCIFFIRENQVNPNLLHDLTEKVMRKTNAWSAQLNEPVEGNTFLESSTMLSKEDNTLQKGYFLEIYVQKVNDPKDVAGQISFYFFLGTNEQNQIVSVAELAEAPQKTTVVATNESQTLH